MSATWAMKLPYRVRCELPDCQKPTNFIFKTEIDGNQVKFCSPYHARMGQDRWEEKKKLNIRLGVAPKNSESEFIGDNTDELIGGGD